MIGAAPPDPTKTKLLAAASELFAEKGFKATTVRQIAARAGVNVAAGHYHYGSKKDLYLEVIGAEFARMHARLEKLGAAVDPAKLGELSRAQLLRLFRTRIEVMAETLIGPAGDRHANLMVREMADPSEAMPTILRDWIAPLVADTRRIIAALRPELDDRHVQNVTFSIAGQIHFYRFMKPMLLSMLGLRAYSPAFIRRITDHVVEFSLGGMDRLAAGARRTR
jgi:AcrR family transcriptional regulator